MHGYYGSCDGSVGHHQFFSGLLPKNKKFWFLIAPIRDRKTTVRRVGFFTPFDRKLPSDFNYIKNFLRRCSNSGEIVQNVRPRPLRFGSYLMSCLESFSSLILNSRFLIGQDGAYFFLDQSSLNQAFCTIVFSAETK